MGLNSTRYEHPINKKKRKVKRVDIPVTIGDYMDNLAIDLVNYSKRIKQIYEIVEKLEWYGHQIRDNYQQIITICKERGIYKSLRRKEQL